MRDVILGRRGAAGPAIAALVTLMLGVATGPAWAADVCEPACPAGAFCAQGECMPRCTDACADGFECLWGECVPLATQPADVHPAPDSPAHPSDVEPFPYVDPGSEYVDPNIPPRPRGAGTGQIIAGWAMVGVGASTAVSGFLLANEIEQNCTSGTTECDQVETAMYVVGALGLGIAIGGAVLAISGHSAKSERNQEIRDWDARYGERAEVERAPRVSVTPAALRDGGGLVVLGEF